MRSVVVVGAGQAGATAALELRRAGFDGEVALLGEEPHLPYERPQLSKDLLRRDAPQIKSLRDARAYDEAGVKLRLDSRVARVDAANRCVELDDGDRLPFDRLLIASGVRPRRLPQLDGDPRVCYLRRFEDAARLRAELDSASSIVIVGGGVIGLEVASEAASRGIRVTVVESAERLMARSVDPILSAFLDRRHRMSGVEFRYAVQPRGWTLDGRLELSDGTSLAADVVLVGIGVLPNVEPFAELNIADAFGVRVDEFGRTAIDSIYATGDVASQPSVRGFSRIETWANAQDHAIATARNLIGEAKAYSSPTWFWSDQGKTNLQILGDARGGEPVARGDANGSAFSLFWLDRDGRIAAAASVNSPKDMAMARRWLGQRVELDPQRLANPSVPLRDCLAASKDGNEYRRNMA
ncbi:MAG: FAD-dependent oxidoreductase [Rudaea sp.]|uniref:NAD(P)/FAD-dependent oxidoreductase n=1 Tax=Rudaea sp. TaxID=2136325 RepID=UPI0039E4E587